MPSALSAQDPPGERQLLDSSQSDLVELFQTESYYDFKLYWSFIKVGTARLEFSELEPNPSDTDLDSKLRIRFSAQSDPILNPIYPVDSWMESTLLKSDLKPHFYEKHLAQGNEQEHSSLSFDWDEQKIYETKNGLAGSPLNLVDDCQDPLSLILSLCQNNFQKTPTHRQSVTDGGKIIQLTSQLIGTERVPSSVGSFNSQQIDIETRDLRGVFKKSPDAQVLLYLHQIDDRLPALPVKFQSKVAIGSFYAVLSGGMHRGQPIRGVSLVKPDSHLHSRDRIYRKFK